MLLLFLLSITLWSRLSCADGPPGLDMPDDAVSGARVPRPTPSCLLATSGDTVWGVGVGVLQKVEPFHGGFHACTFHYELKYESRPGAVFIRGVTIPFISGSGSGIGITKRLRIKLWIQILGWNHDR